MTYRCKYGCGFVTTGWTTLKDGRHVNKALERLESHIEHDHPEHYEEYIKQRDRMYDSDPETLPDYRGHQPMEDTTP